MGASYEAATIFLLKPEGYEEGANRITRANQRIQLSQNSVARTSNKMGQQISGRGNMAVQNLAFGIEDAAVGYQLNGFAGAMRGATNNISMMALAVGGLKGLLVGLGITLLASVISPLSSLAQHTSVFEKMTESLKKFDAALKRRKDRLAGDRSVADTMRNFNRISDSGTLFRTIEDQTVGAARAKEDLADAKKNLADVKSLRDQIVQGDRSELERKNIFTRGLASLNPYMADVMDANFGTNNPDFWANTKEINEAFDPIIERMQGELDQASEEALTQQNALFKMTFNAPKVLSSITGKTAEVASQQFQKAMSEGGLGLKSQYQLEVAEIKSAAQSDIEQIREVINDPQKQTEMIQTIEKTQDLMLDQARRKFESGIESKLQEAEDSLLLPLEADLKKINAQADALIDDVLHAGLDKDSRRDSLDRIESLRQKMITEAEKKNPKKSSRETTAGSIFAGSDQIFATVFGRSEHTQKAQLQELRKIATTVGAQAKHKIEIIK